MDIRENDLKKAIKEFDSPTAYIDGKPVKHVEPMKVIRRKRTEPRISHENLVLRQTRGFEKVGNNNVLKSRISLIQERSTAREFVVGSKPGDFFNTVTYQNYGQSLTIVPVFFEIKWLLYCRKMEDGSSGGNGGFRGSYPSLESVKAGMKVLNERDGVRHNIEETKNHAVLIVHSETDYEEAFFSFSRTKKQTSNRWNSIMLNQSKDEDVFAYMYNVTSYFEKRGKYDIYNLKLTPLDRCTTQAFTSAENFYKKIKSRSVSIG